MIAWTVTGLSETPVWQLLAYADDMLIAILDPGATEVSPGHWEANLIIPLNLPAGQYSITIRDDVSGASGGSGNFTITGAPTEVVTVSNPGTGDTVTPGGGFVITWHTTAAAPPPPTEWLIECYRLLVQVDLPSTYVTIVDGGSGNYHAVWNPPPTLGDDTANYHLKITNVATGVSGENGEVFTLEGLDPATFTTAPVLPNATIGVAYSENVHATGGLDNFTYALASGSSLPNGLTLDPPTGDITGTPTGPAAVAHVTITASDPIGVSVTQVFSIDVSAAAPTTIVITTTSLPTATVGIPYSVQLQQLYGTAPTWSEVGLPDGLTLDTGTGVISGTPTTVEAPLVDFTCSDGILIDGEATIQLTVSAAPPTQIVITTTTLPTATVGVPYSAQLQQIYGTAPTWSEVGLPAGLTLHATTGVISGTPTTPGAPLVDFTCSDGILIDGEETIQLTVSAAPPTQIVITTTTLPGGTVGIAYFVQLTQLYGTTPTWGATGLPAGLTLNTSLGQISGTPTTPVVGSVVLTCTDGIITAATPVTLPLVVNPALQPGSVQFTFSDGFVATVPQGTNTVLTNGYSNGAQTLDLTAGSLKIAPNGTPGIRVYCIPQGNALRCGFKATGRGRFSGSGLAQPIYFIRAIANMPGRVVPYGETFRNVRSEGGGIFTLIESTDPKHPAAQSMLAGGNAFDAAYARTVSEHWVDGGMGAEWLFVPDTDPIEQSMEPTAAAKQMARDVFDFDLERIAEFPALRHFIDLYKTDAFQADNPTLPRAQMREAWMMYGANIHTHGFDGSVLAGPAPYTRLMDWHHGMSIFTVVTGGNTNGHYHGNFWWGVRYLLQTELGIVDPDSAYESFAMGLGINRQSIRCGFWMNEVTDTNNKGRYVNEQSSVHTGGPGINLLAQRGHSASTLAPAYDKEYDWASMFYLIMRPDDQLHQEWFTHRLARLLSSTQNFVNIMNGQGGRGPASWFRGLLIFYRYCLAIGDTANAALLKTKAEQGIEAMYLHGIYPLAYPTPMFFTRSTNPSQTPNTLGSPGLSGASEGMYTYIAKWMFDIGTNDGVTSPDRRDWFKDSALFHLVEFTQGVGTGLAGWAYTWFFDMTPTTPPPGAHALYYGNINTPTSVQYLGDHEQGTYLFPLLPYLLDWFPGYILPNGATIEQRCANLVNNSYDNPDYNTPATMGAAWYGVDNYNFPKTHRFLLHGVPLAHIGE